MFSLIIIIMVVLTTTSIQKNIAFVHVLDGLAFGFHKLGEPFTLKDARAVLPKSVTLIGNCGFVPSFIVAAFSNHPNFGRRIDRL